MIELEQLTITKAHEALVRGDFKVSELVEAYKKNITEKNSEIHAYLEVFDDTDQVARAQKMIDEGKADVLTGIPMAIKDNILIKGKIASASSKMLENYTATYDASVITKLREKGVVFLGRTNMDEFAMGGSTETSAYGITKNPLDTTRVPGGSSGGSAAAVAMNGALVALGSDTGGSVRQPAAYCGCVGLKPTYGAVSRSGLMAMGSSLDQIGPLTKTVSDSEIIFNTLRFHDSLDSTSVSDDVYAGWKKEPKGVIGFPKAILEEKELSEDVRANIEQAITVLKERGFKIKEVELPTLHYALAAYYIIMPAEVSTNLSRFDGVKYGLYKEGDNLTGDYFETRGAGFGDEVRRRIMLGTYVLSAGYYDAYYNKAIRVKEKIQAEFRSVFEDIDALIMPTTPTPAFKIGEKKNNPLEMYLTDIFTVPANIAGVPALSVPFGESEGIPLGVQLLASWGNEATLFNIGKKLTGEAQ